MKKLDLLRGTACGTVMFCSAVVFAGHAVAQDNGATPIQGISKSAGGTGTVAQALKQKIPLKSQYAASHIGKAEIATKSPVATLDSILNTEPSIHATSAGPLGVEQQITFRDFNSAEFTQTFDHVSLNDVFNAGATNSASVYNNVLITPLEIQGVDLYRGINNPANNSYNSLAGTINYDPVLPSDTMGGSLSGNFGSFDTMGFSAIYNTGKVNGFSNVIAFSRETTKGWLQGDKDSNSNFYDAFNQDIDPTGKIYGLVVYNTNNGEEAYDIPAPLIQALGRNFQYPKSIYNEPLQNTNDLIIFGATQGLGDIATVDLKGFFGADNFTRNAFSNSAYQSTGYYVFNKDVNHTDTTFYGYYGTEAGFQPTVTLDLPYNTITAGANYTLGHLHSREYYSNIDPVPQMPGVNDIWDEHDVRTEYSVYVQDEVDLLNDRLKLTPGLKYLYANSKDHDDAGYDYPVAGSVSSTAHFISPTFGASYEFIPNTVLYAAYGQNIEFPTIDAYYDNIDGQNAQGNYENNVEPVHLQPEHVDDYEAGLRYSNQPLGFAGALGFYLENFTNTFIESVDPTSQLQTTSNGGSSQYKGIELQLTQDFGHPHYDGNDLGDFSGYLNYSYNDAYFTSNFTVSSVGNNNASLSTVHKNDPVALVPRDTVDFGGNWSLDGFGANIDAQYVTAQFINQETAGTPSSLQEPAYFVLNLQLSKTIPVQHFGIVKSIEIALNIDNALDREYDAYAYSETYSTPKNPPGPYVAPKGSTGTYASIQQAAPQAFYGSVTLKF